MELYLADIKILHIIVILSSVEGFKSSAHLISLLYFLDGREVSLINLNACDLFISIHIDKNVIMCEVYMI